MNRLFYETMMIFNTKLGEEEIKALIEKFKNIIESNGAIIGEIQEWGKRKLAYEIDDKITEGYYVLITFESDPEFPAELDRVCNITDGVIRSLIIRQDK